MIPVEQTLKTAFNPNNGKGGRYIDYSVTWGVTNQEAQENATAMATESEISRLPQITQRLGMPLKVATFEDEGFPLDGSALVPPKSTEVGSAVMGLIFQEFSDTNKEFANPQTLTINFDYYFDWVALTINFGLVTAVDFTIEYYEDSAIIETTTVTENTLSQYEDEKAIEGCNKVVISIIKINRPYTMARITEVVFGTIRVYNKSNSESLEITEQIDILNERVPINDMKISVDNFAAEYNIFDPSGIYEHLRTRQKFDIKIGTQQENNIMGYVNMGSYYLQSPELKNNFSKLNLQATNILGILQDTIYSKGVYKTATIEDFLNDVATDVGVNVSYPLSFADLTLSAYIPSISHTEAFRRIAQATNTIMFVNRNDTIVFAEIDNNILQTFTQIDYAENNGLEPSDDTIINTIEVESVSYAVNSSAEKLAEINGDGIITVKYDVSTNQSVSLTSGTLVSAIFNADNAVLEVENAVGEIMGKKLTTTTKTVFATNTQANETKLIYSAKSNPFIQSANASSVAEHYLNIRASKRRTIQMQYRGYPYIEMGDSVSFVADNYITRAFAVCRNNLKLSGGMTATLEAREI